MFGKKKNSPEAIETENSNNEEQDRKLENNGQSFVEDWIDKKSIGGKYMSEKKNLKNMLFLSISINAGLILILMLFSISFVSVMKDRDVSIMIPPSVLQDTTLSFGSTRASREVFEVYADYLGRAFGNYDYTNVDKVYDNLLKYADGSIKHRFHRLLVNNAKFVKENFITNKFQLAKIKLDSDNRGGIIAYVYGYATRKVGSKIQFENMPYLYKIWFDTYRANVSIVGMSSSINMNPEKAADKFKVDHYETDNKYINF